MLTITPLTEDDWRLWRTLRLEALREAPYAFGSTLAEWQGTGDTEERWRRRLATVPLNIIAHLDETPAGMAGAYAPNEARIAELISMWVAPFARGRGVGNALIDAVAAWAMQRDASSIALAVREQNRRAIALYERNGFAACTDPPIPSDDCSCEMWMIRELRQSS